jgi:hypothetical protein
VINTICSTTYANFSFLVLLTGKKVRIALVATSGHYNPEVKRAFL